MSELFHGTDFGGFMSRKTQPDCRVFDDLHTTGFVALRATCHGKQRVAMFYNAGRTSST